MGKAIHYIHFVGHLRFPTYYPSAGALRAVKVARYPCPLHFQLSDALSFSGKSLCLFICLLLLLCGLSLGLISVCVDFCTLVNFALGAFRVPLPFWSGGEPLRSEFKRRMKKAKAFQMTPAISTFKYQKYYDFYPVPKDFSSYSKL